MRATHLQQSEGGRASATEVERSAPGAFSLSLGGEVKRAYFHQAELVILRMEAHPFRTSDSSCAPCSCPGDPVTGFGPYSLTTRAPAETFGR